jgi:hypothetical protein
MKKLCCMLALAAISYGSVYAATGTVKATPAMQDTTKKKVKVKGDKKKVKMKNDSTKTKMKMKKDTMSKM